MMFDELCQDCLGFGFGTSGGGWSRVISKTQNNRMCLLAREGTISCASYDEYHDLTTWTTFTTLM